MADECTPPEEAFAETSDRPEVVIISGMSGAGRSEAIHTFEDLGYFCIDNLPPSFIMRLVELAELPDSRIRRIALVSDVRGEGFFDELQGALGSLEDAGVPHRVLFLEADDETLQRRFSETRRRHPLCTEGGTVSEGIDAERERLAGLRGRADMIIDTSPLKPRDLRLAIKERFLADTSPEVLSITVSSFGFKYGTPTDADIVMDVRFLPNPFYNPKLRQHTGLEEPVREYVLGRAETREFVEKWHDLLATLVPGYLAEGKTHLAVALGCTGGMHRSVVLAEETAHYLRELGFRVAVSHRDIGRDREV
jgi:UPF0042 nucleotide-binding protein